MMQKISWDICRYARNSGKMPCTYSILKRGKKKKANTKTGCDFALEHFDTFYRPMYGDLWPSIRISLLTTKKTCAVLNNYAKLEELYSRLTSAYNMVQDALNAIQERLSQTAVTQNQIDKTQGSINLQNVSLVDSEQKTENDQNVVADFSRTDLDVFIPAENVFSERDTLRMEEVSKSTFTPGDVKVNFIRRSKWTLPEQLQVMVYPEGDIRRFPDPRGSPLSHYMMDAASVLPVIALDLQKDDHVLDLCSAPGGKTLTILQTMLPEKLLCVDTSLSRLNRLRKTLEYYLPKDALQMVETSLKDGRELDHGVFDKVLVDVPCTTDRHSLLEPINNLFVTPRLRERLSLPVLQKELLLAGIKSCAPGGSVVYSTCTLSFVQNDGVVQQAIEEIWKSSNIDLVIEDLTPLQTIFKNTFKFYDACRYGQLVIPSLSSNFGPMYFCKINRTN